MTAESGFPPPAQNPDATASQPLQMLPKRGGKGEEEEEGVAPGQSRLTSGRKKLCATTTRGKCCRRCTIILAPESFKRGVLCLGCGSSPLRKAGRRAQGHSTTTQQPPFLRPFQEPAPHARARKARERLYGSGRASERARSWLARPEKNTAPLSDRLSSSLLHRSQAALGCDFLSRWRPWRGRVGGELAVWLSGEWEGGKARKDAACRLSGL